MTQTLILFVIVSLSATPVPVAGACLCADGPVPTTLLYRKCSVGVWARLPRQLPDCASLPGLATM